jgi:hypothetical protein
MGRSSTPLLLLASLAACGDNLDRSIVITINGSSIAPPSVQLVAAYQDGSGAWRNAPTPVGDTFRFDISSDTWGFAWSCFDGANAWVTIYEFTHAERARLVDDLIVICEPTPPVTLSGTMDIPTAFDVWFGANQGSASHDQYSLAVVSGKHDLVASDPAQPIATRASVRRGFVVAGDTQQDLRYEDMQPTTTAPISGLAVDGNVYSYLVTAGGTTVDLLNENGAPAGGFVAVGLADAEALAGDVYVVSMDSGLTGVTTVTSSIGPQTFTPPPPLGTSTSRIVATVPHPRILTTWSDYPDAVGYSWEAGQFLPCAPPNDFCGPSWFAMISPGVAGSPPRFETPDFSTVNGWDDRIAFQDGATSDHTVRPFVSAITSSRGPDAFGAVWSLAPQPIGTTTTSAGSTSTVQP